MSDQTELKKEKPFLVQIFFNLLAILYMVTFVFSFVYLIQHPEIITLTFTNIGFAVFLTLANTFFSWGRSLDEKKYGKEIKDINLISFWAIVGALTFIITSLLLFMINSISLNDIEDPTAAILSKTLSFIRGILLFLVTGIAFVILLEAYRSIFSLLSKEYFVLDIKDPEKDQGN